MKSSDRIPSLEEIKTRKKRSKKGPPSNETCRTALANFFSVIFARQYVPPEEPEFVDLLERHGADPDKVKEAANMAQMIKELRWV